MSTSRRNFLKAAGLTAGCATLGGAGMVIAAPNQKPDEYLESKKQVFESLCGDDKTFEQIHNEAFETAPPRQLVKENHYYSISDPQIWAQEALFILEENLGIGALVHRDFQQYTARYGDMINIHRPASFRINRRSNDDALYPYPSERETQHIVLNNHLCSQFVMTDYVCSRSFQDLVDMFVYPAMFDISKALDMVIIEKMMQTKNRSISHDVCNLMFDGHMKMNVHRAPIQGRYAAIPHSWKTDLLKNGCEVIDGNKLKYLGLNIFADSQVETGLVFHKGSTVLATRPLKLPSTYTGCNSAVANHNDLSLRCTMQPDIAQAGIRVTFDILAGSGIIDDNLLCRMDRIPDKLCSTSILDKNLKTIWLS